MPWLELRALSSADDASRVEDALLSSGAHSVTLEDNEDQPIYEPNLGETPLWSSTRVTGLFDADIDTECTLLKVMKLCGLTKEKFYWHILEDKDWQREWMKHYTAIQCSHNFWICPSWQEPPDAKAINLLLDPGLAFGTGTHPTTFQCLEWIAQQDITDKTVVDYGCGSGILGIAALLFGAQKVTGVDIDPQALLATHDNVQRNALNKENFPVYLPKDLPDIKVDFVFANILAGPLVELCDPLVSLLNPGGKICLSGILSSQQNALVESYSKSINIDKVSQKEDWLCISGSIPK